MGVVGDVRRDMEGHHYAEKCSVFGISAEELKVLHRSFKCWRLLLMVLFGRSTELTNEMFQQWACDQTERVQPIHRQISGE